MVDVGGEGGMGNGLRDTILIGGCIILMALVFGVVGGFAKGGFVDGDLGLFILGALSGLWIGVCVTLNARVIYD